MRRLLVALVLLTACGTTSHSVASISLSPTVPAATPSPQPTPQASPALGIVYDGTATLEMVDSNGAVVTSANATRPHRFNAGLPWTSATLKRVYHLDQAGDVLFLAPDGSTGTATHVSTAAGEEAGFAVSPDDRLIAVAILRYRPDSSYLGMRMYVEDLSGGGHHVDIYSSSVNAEYPIGWTGGRLIVALSTPLCCASAPLNPYGAVEYHVVDPTTGNRLVTLCRGTSGPVGPPTTVGVACKGGQGSSYLHWDGSACCNVGAAGSGALSPDGNAVAWSAPPPTGIEIGYGPNSSNVANINVTGVAGDVEGWLDLTHVVYRARSDSTLHIGLLPSLAGPAVAQSSAATVYLGAFPTAIS